MPFLINRRSAVARVDRIVVIPATPRVAKHLLITGCAFDSASRKPAEIHTLDDSVDTVKRIYDVRTCERWDLPRNSRVGFEISIDSQITSFPLEISFGECNVKVTVDIEKCIRQLRREYKHRSLRRYVRYAYAALRGGGLQQFERAFARRSSTDSSAYETWIAENENPDRDAAILLLHQFKKTPLISIVVPVYNVEREWLTRFVSSIQSQWYENWELCLADDHSSDSRVRPLVEKFVESDSRIHAVFRTQNGHISQATNSAIKIAKGNFIGFADDDDELAPDALYEVVKTVNEYPTVDFFYSDEDQIDEHGKRGEPAFKPDFSPNTLLTRNYINHFTVVSKDLLDRVGPLRSEFDGSQDFDFVLRAAELTHGIHHIPKILYHWRTLESSVAGDPWSKRYAYEAGKHALEAALDRRHISAAVTMLEDLGRYRIDYFGPDKSALVLVNEATHGIVEEIEKLTQYSDFSVRACHSESLVSEAEKSSADYIVLLDGVVPKDPLWLEHMMCYTRASDVAVVGGKVYDSRGRVDDAGVSLAALRTGKPFEGRGSLEFGTGYQFRTYLAQDLFAVTEQCLLISRQTFIDAGGMNLKLPRGLRGIDLCVRVCDLTGETVLWEPYSTFRRLGSQVNISMKEAQLYCEKHPCLTDRFQRCCFPLDFR